MRASQPGASRAGRESRRELDWVLISKGTLYSGCSRFCLPGISTHMALVVDLALPTAHLSPLDPTGRQFRFNRATEQQLGAAREFVALYSWWGCAAGLTPDGVVRLCWDGMRSHIPLVRRSQQVLPHDVAEALGEADPAWWWSERTDVCHLSPLPVLPHPPPCVQIGPLR